LKKLKVIKKIKFKTKRILENINIGEEDLTDRKPMNFVHIVSHVGYKVLANVAF